MSQAFNRWGIELDGAEEDRKAWRARLKPPFDPFVEKVKHERGDYLVLRSSAFDEMTTAEEVHWAGKQLFATLNLAMSKSADIDPVTNKSVVDFVADGPPLQASFPGSKKHRDARAHWG
jgi:hypothetical protein